VDSAELIETFRRIVGAEALATGPDARAYGWDGFEPLAAIMPASAEQLAQVIRVAADAGLAVVPRGGGTKLAALPKPTKPAIVLCTERLRRITAYEPRDLTVSVQAGMPLAKLNAFLGEHRQRLPLDPPNDDRATIGGICAANDSGPLRLAHGTPRDWVLGMGMVLPDGTMVKSGGQVVKNMAGYDVHRLFIGSFGSLGLITQITLRLRPRPEATRLASGACRNAPAAETTIATVLAGPTRPCLIELLNAPAAGQIGLECPEDGLVLIVGFEGDREAVEWQLEQIRGQLGAGTCLHGPEESEALLRRIRQWPGGNIPPRSPATEGCAAPAVAFKASVPSSHVAAFFEHCRSAPLALMAHAGSGILYGRSTAVMREEQLTDLLMHATAVGGHMIFHALPVGSSCPRWGRARNDAFLAEAIKKQFDPADRFPPAPCSPPDEGEPHNRPATASTPAESDGIDQRP